MRQSGLFKEDPCVECPLNGRVKVPFSGKLSSKIMLVGEKPGPLEEKHGKSFVGETGGVVDKLLKGLGMARSQVVLANARRCMPDKKETDEDKKQSLQQCRYFLQKAIDATKPILIVAMGNDALVQLGGRSGIMKSAGRMFFSSLHKCWILPTVNPAYALRVPQAMEGLATSFAKVRDFHETGHASIQQGVYRKLSLEEFVAWTKKAEQSKLVSRDCESDNPNHSSLHWFRPDTRIVCMSFCCDGQEGVVVFPDQDERFPAAISEFTSHKQGGPIFTAHNGMFFDDPLMRMKGYDVSRVRVDSLIAAHLIDENRSNSEEALAYVYGEGMGGYSAQFDAKYSKDRMGEVPEPDLINYSGGDAVAQHRIHQGVFDELRQNERQILLYKKLLVPAALALQDAMIRGVGFDENARVGEKKVPVREAITERTNQLYRECLALVPPSVMRRHDDIRLTQDAFIRDVLFAKDGLGFTPTVFTKQKKEPSVAKAVLEDIDHPFAAMVIEWNELDRCVSSYIDGFARFCVNGRVYPTYSLTNSVTGRTSASEPPLQQIPKRKSYSKMIRAQFVASEGYEFLSLDYSQVELKLAAWRAGEKNMLEAFRRGKDLHCLTASGFCGRTVGEDDPMRAAGKASNFGLVFKQSWQGLQHFAWQTYRLRLTDQQAQRYHAGYHGMYPAIGVWHEEAEELITKNGYAEDPLGFRRHLPNASSSDEYFRAEAIRQGINAEIQGFATRLALLGVAELRNYTDRGIFNIGFVHDQVICEVELGDGVEKRRAQVKEVMEQHVKRELKSVFGVDLPFVPTTDMSRGTRLSEMVKA